MSVGIKILAEADTGRSVGIIKPWVRSVDWTARDGWGEITFTVDPARAMRFDTNAEAYMFWQTVSAVRPLRPDGEPNRPLTAWTVEIGELPT